MRAFLKILRILVICMVVITAFSLPVSAKTTRAVSYALSGYRGNEADVFTPENGGGIRILDMTAPWDFSGEFMDVKRHLENGYCTAYVILDTDDTDGSVVFELELDDDLSAYEVLCFGVGYTSWSTSPAPLTAELELFDSAGNRVVSQTVLTPPEEDSTKKSIFWSMLYFDISEFGGRDDASSLTVTFSFDPSAPPNVLRITNPYAAERDGGGGLERIDRYLTDSFTASAGAIAMKSGAARPDERGQVHLNGALVLADPPETGADAFLEIEMSHFHSGGLTVGIGYASGETVYSGRIYLDSDGTGTEVYVVPVEVNGEAERLELLFDGMACDGYFRLGAVRLHSTDTVTVSGTPELGRVSRITRDGDHLRFSGVMEREAVRRYDEDVLRFYAVPFGLSGNPENAVEIGRTKVSTRFDYTADLSAYPNYADVCLFFAGIRTEDGEILPLSAPVYPTAAALSASTVSNIGLYDASSVGVFESNVSHVIVDVPLDELVTAAETAGDAAVLLSYPVYVTAESGDGAAPGIESRTKQAVLSHALLRSLDSEINFYISAGIEVYLRLASDTPVPGLTYTEDEAEHYAVSADTDEARYFYASIVRCLCRRYSGIAGITVGYAVNDGRQTGCRYEDGTAAYALQLAEFCRITYNAAVTEIPDILLVLPFGEKPGGGDRYGFIDPKSLTVMLSSYLERMGTVPWALMYCTEDLRGILGKDILSGADLAADAVHSDSRGDAERIRQHLNELGLQGSAALMYCFEPYYETMTDGFSATPSAADSAEYLAEMFVKLCGSTRARAVFLSLDRVNDRLEHEFYAYLKKTESAAGAGTSRRSVSDFAAVPASEADNLPPWTAQIPVWDFTEQFHPLGWIAGGGVASCQTVYSDLFSEASAPGSRYARVLRSHITLDEDSASPDRKGIAAGISLRNLTRTVDLSEVDCLEFTFALDHPGMIMGTGHEAGTVVFIVGSDDCRAEFEVGDAAYGQIQTYICDLSAYEFRGRVDYMGIMVYGDHEMYLDLSSVKACSSTLEPWELEQIFAPVPVTETSPADYAELVLASGIVFIVSVSAAILFIRRDAEEQRERRLRLETEKRTRRDRTKSRRY